MTQDALDGHPLLDARQDGRAGGRGQVHLDAQRELEARLSALYRPAGRRLGILAVAGGSPSVERAVDAVIASRGRAPARYAARLRPRVGEPSVRPDDLLDFVSRYGHEYSLTVLDERSSPGRDRLDEAIRAAGSTPVWVSSEDNLTDQ